MYFCVLLEWKVEHQFLKDYLLMNSNIGQEESIGQWLEPVKVHCRAQQLPYPFFMPLLGWWQAFPSQHPSPLVAY